MMKNIKQTEYANRLIILTFALIFLVGATGLVTVWLRHGIATAASETRAMEVRLNEVDRALARVNSEIAAGLNPSFLHQQIERFDLDLRRPDDEQIVRLGTPEVFDGLAGESGSAIEGMAYREGGGERSR